MTSTWNEDGIDDSGERMYDQTTSLQQQQQRNDDFISYSSSKPSPLKYFSRNLMLTNHGGGNAGASSSSAATSTTIGRQRQVQHLREVHRLKLEALNNERPEGSRSEEHTSELQSQ